jgi:hypothetical protein
MKLPFIVSRPRWRRGARHSFVGYSFECDHILKWSGMSDGTGYFSRGTSTRSCKYQFLGPFWSIRVFSMVHLVRIHDIIPRFFTRLQYHRGQSLSGFISLAHFVTARVIDVKLNTPCGLGQVTSQTKFQSDVILTCLGLATMGPKPKTKSAILN